MNQNTPDKFENYAHPEVLVSTEWVEENLDQLKSDEDDYRLVEVNVDTDVYFEAHIPGAVSWDWESELCDQVQRDLVPKDEFEDLLEESGISNNTTIILYGDNYNWFAAWAFWQLKYYGHDDIKLMDGGRSVWIHEQRELSQEEPDFPPGTYQADEPDEEIRTYAPDIEKILGQENVELVDVRSEEEFTGEKIAPEGMSETAQRGGHIPGATNIGWSDSINPNGTFKTREELDEIYTNKGITDDKKTITYCRIGERSSLSWFVVKYLLGNDDVVNYDGSWTEWGNIVSAPIERGQ